MKKTKKDTWEVYYCRGVYRTGGRDRYIFRGKKFSELSAAWEYACKSCYDISSGYCRQRFVLITQNGEKPSVEAVIPKNEDIPHTVLQRVYWLPYQALLPPEYLTADGVRPLPWRSTLARLRKAVAGKGYYEDTNNEKDHEH